MGKHGNRQQDGFHALLFSQKLFMKHALVVISATHKVAAARANQFAMMPRKLRGAVGADLLMVGYRPLSRSGFVRHFWQIDRTHLEAGTNRKHDERLA